MPTPVKSNTKVERYSLWKRQVNVDVKRLFLKYSVNAMRQISHKWETNNRIWVKWVRNVRFHWMSMRFADFSLLHQLFAKIPMI